MPAPVAPRVQTRISLLEFPPRTGLSVTSAVCTPCCAAAIAAQTPAGRYHDSSEDTILAHALEYIRINYKSRITVTALAEFCHCSDSYLSRIFKRRTGVNINVYVNKVRMEFTKSPLCLSDESIAEIAASVGFGDPNYFSRVFTQIIGIPPTEFRKRFHQNNG